MRHFNRCFFLLMMVVTANVFGQEVWPLEKCVKTALTNNLSIQTSALNIESNAVDIKSAQHARYPNLSIGSDVYWNFGRTIDPTSNTFTTSTFFRNGLNLNAGATLFNGFAIKNNIEQAKTNQKALLEDKAQMERDIALNVATLYLNAIFAKENLAIAQSNLTLTKNSLTQMEAMIRSGTKAANESLDIEAQLATDEQNVLVANNNLINAKMQLRQLMLVNVDFDIVVPSISIDESIELMDFEAVYNEAIKHQHGIQAEEYRVKASELGIKIAKGQVYPTISVGGNLGSNYSNQGQVIKGVELKPFTQQVFIDNNPVPVNITTLRESVTYGDASYLNQFDNNLSYGVGFSVSMPILNNYNTTSRIEKAKIASAASRITLETKKQSLKVTVQQSLTDAKAAKLKLASAEKALKANEAAYENANKRFSLGAINGFDLTNARTRLDNARNNALIAKYDYIFKVKVLDFYLGKGISI